MAMQYKDKKFLQVLDDLKKLSAFANHNIQIDNRTDLNNFNRFLIGENEKLGSITACTIMDAILALLSVSLEQKDKIEELEATVKKYDNHFNKIVGYTNCSKQ